MNQTQCDLHKKNMEQLPPIATLWFYL